MGIDQALWNPRHRTPVLLVSTALIVAIAVTDWATTPYFSLGFLYLFPILLSAAFLPRWLLVLLGVACAMLSIRFSNLPMLPVRLTFLSMSCRAINVWRNLIESNCVCS
jgi:hypothetical protein